MTVIDPYGNGRGGVYYTDRFNVNFHTRGATSIQAEKKGWKVNITDAKGNPKRVALLGMDADDDWIIRAISNDSTKMREKIALDVWNDLSDFGNYHAEYCEVFMDGDYYGLCNAPTSKLDFEFGWFDVVAANIVYDSGAQGYVINLPRPVPLDLS